MQFLPYLGTGSKSFSSAGNPSTALRPNPAVQTPNKAIPRLVGLKQDKADHLILSLVVVCPFPPIITATEMELKSGGITPKARRWYQCWEGARGRCHSPTSPSDCTKGSWPLPGQALGPDPKHMEVI